MPAPSRSEVIAYFLRTYAEEYDELGPEGVEAILDRGRRWDLSRVLTVGGALVFPHVHIADCGPYTAAVVHACLESGADRVLAIGVLHASTDALAEARERVGRGETQPEDQPLRGIYGPGAPMVSDVWKGDHGLYGFRRLMADEAKRRGVRAPEIIERYPFLTGPRAESLAGIEDLRAIVRDAVVVSTADHCHHGIGYGHTRQEALYWDERGVAAVRRIIEDGLAMLDAGRVAEYLEHSASIAKSDWRDAGPVVHHLLGPLRSIILDIVPSDFANSIYQAPSPTWCAGALVKLEPVRV